MVKHASVASFCSPTVGAIQLSLADELGCSCGGFALGLLRARNLTLLQQMQHHFYAFTIYLYLLVGCYRKFRELFWVFPGFSEIFLARARARARDGFFVLRCCGRRYPFHSNGDRAKPLQHPSSLSCIAPRVGEHTPRCCIGAEVVRAYFILQP